MLKVLLLGSNGQLGTDLVRLSSQSSTIKLIPCSRADCDLADVDGARQFLKKIDFDVLVNATGYHKTDEVEGNAGHAFIINADLPGALAELCCAKKARMIHISTDYVFGGQIKREPLTETDAAAPVNIYGSSKLMGEALCISSGADVVIARVASLFGVAGASGKGGNFVETMIRLAKERGRLSVVDDQIMNPTATADIAEALMRIIDVDPASGIYHVTGTGQCSWYEFAREIVSAAGLNKVVVEPVPSSSMLTIAKRPRYSALSNGKLAQIIGWSMPPWRMSLQKYLYEKGHTA